MLDGTLKQIRQRLLDGMIEFMEPDGTEPNSNCGYTQADIDKCAVIVDSYLQSIRTVENSNQIAISNTIRNTVEQLNELNESCDGCLIETDQREDLCELILAAAKSIGIESDDDVTEQWRDW